MCSNYAVNFNSVPSWVLEKKSHFEDEESVCKKWRCFWIFACNKKQKEQDGQDKDVSIMLTLLRENANLIKARHKKKHHHKMDKTDVFLLSTDD